MKVKRTCHRLNFRVLNQLGIVPTWDAAPSHHLTFAFFYTFSEIALCLDLVFALFVAVGIASMAEENKVLWANASGTN